MPIGLTRNTIWCARFAKGKYQYIRNFQPYLPDGLKNNYRYKMLAYSEWRELWKAGKLSGVQQQFFQPRPTEQLFDCEADPHQVHNLAAEPGYTKVLVTLRTRLQNWMTRMPDLSLYPESYLVENAMDDPVRFGQEHQEEISTLLQTADLALQPWSKARPAVARALKSNRPAIRYWAATVCTTFGQQASDVVADVEPLLKDESMTVRIRAAEFLGSIGKINPQTVLTDVVNTTENPVEATEALNSVVWFRDFFGDRYPVKRDEFKPVSKGADIDDRLNYINGEPYPKKPAANKKRPNKKAA